MGPWTPRGQQLRLRVEDGLVTIEIRGVLDAHTAAMARAEFLVVCGIAKAITVDLGAVHELRTDAGLEELLGEFRRECALHRTGLRVVAAHPRVLTALRTWGIDTNNGRYEWRTRSTGLR
ncbi:STAS domain-containing protein [Kribbella sp. NPDC051770]|uniref:STAS domain-containing protein n=1 Tax=Kribbella sp. NPDC051770 TaxID=3155413 RepID=UPI00343E0909